MTTSMPAARFRPRTTVLLALCLVGVPGAARAHASVARADPKVGSTVDASPEQVRIWFDREVEAASSSIEVHGPGGGAMHDGRAHVDPSNPKLLEVTVRPLVAGIYRVTWSVVARDGHRTSGEYRFTVR